MQYFFGNRIFDLRGYYGVVFINLWVKLEKINEVSILFSHVMFFVGLVSFLEKTYINIKSNRYLIFDAKKQQFFGY